MQNTTAQPQARPKSDPHRPIDERGRYWCPECEVELSDAQDDEWHHYFGERGDCTWTD